MQKYIGKKYRLKIPYVCVMPTNADKNIFSLREMKVTLLNVLQNTSYFLRLKFANN